jgi:hypothetical protein
MAWTFQIEDATTSLNLNDGTSFKIMPGGFGAPSPTLRATYAGDGNLFRSGSRLIRQSYNNRIVTLGLQVIGTSTDVLASNIESLETYLRSAQEFSSFASGSQVKLRYQWDSATSPVFFHVLTGTFDAIDAAQHGPMLTLNTRLANARLTLVCEPFAYGAQEVISNYVDDPSFEVAGTALADWTESKTATGTTARSTAQAKFGDASLLLTMTDSGGSGQVIERNQTLTDVDAGETWSFEVWAYVTALSSAKAGLVLLYNDGSATTATSYITSTNSGFVQMTLANQTPPSGATQVIVKLRLEATAADATGTAYFDAVTAVADSAIPTTWVSSRNVGTIYTDASQATTNFIDIYNVPGNQPALLQLKAAENEAHTKLWMGARHNGRLGDAGLWHEAEDFVNTAWLVDNSDGATSGGNETRISRLPTFVRIATGEHTSNATTVTAASQAIDGERPYLVAYVAQNGSPSGTPTCDSVVFNSDQSMTKVGDVSQGTGYRLTAWVLNAPTAATGTTVATFGSAAVTAACITVAVYNGVAETTTVHSDVDTVSGSGTSTSAITSTVTAIGDMVSFGAHHANSNATTLGGGLTEREDETFGSNKLSMYDLISDAATESPSASWSGSVVNAAIGFIIKAGADSPSNPVVITKAIATPPRGQYRVLARVDGQGAVWSLGVGYAYGSITETPSTAGDYPGTTSTSAGYEIVDLGTLTIPPVPVPENVTTGSFTVRVATYLSTAAASKTLDLDWVMLVPIDFGSLYLSKTSGTDVIFSDSISDLRTAAILNTSDVLQSIPSTQGGDPPTIHPDGTRLYFIADDGAADIDHGWKMAVRIEPRFLSVAGT